MANESGYRCVVNPAKSRVRRSQRSLFDSSDPDAHSLVHHTSSVLGRLLCAAAVPDGVENSSPVTSGVCAAPRSMEGTRNASRHYFSTQAPGPEPSSHSSQNKEQPVKSGTAKTSKCPSVVPPLRLRSQDGASALQGRSAQGGGVSTLSVCSSPTCSVACCADNPSVSSGNVGIGSPAPFPALQESDADTRSSSQCGTVSTKKETTQGTGPPCDTLVNHCRKFKKKHLFTRFYAATVPAAVLDADKQQGLTPHQERVRSRVRLPDLGGDTFDYPLPPAILYHSRAAEAVSPEMLGLQKPVLPKRDSGVFHLQGERFEEAMKIPLTPRSVMALPLPERKRLLYNMLCCFCIELAEGTFLRIARGRLRGVPCLGQ